MARLPSLFVSHGAPTFALAPGRAGQALAQLGQQLVGVKAIVVVSAHWQSQQLTINANPQPVTVHDFGGFPQPLYELEYPVQGHPQLAHAVSEYLQVQGYQPRLDSQRGLDHGVWVPLLHLRPQADWPVVQLSLPYHASPQWLFDLGQALNTFAEQGVLIIGSGSLTHNLQDVVFNAQQPVAYAERFQQWITERLQQHDRAAVIRALNDAPDAARAHPTTEHFLPLLFALGAAAPDYHLQTIKGGIEHRALAMDGFCFNQ
ncbi:dioxygenase [Idiomarina tyrosinivorans]|uniref:Dioxygenase n=1 Tax=Idiomarina tyrosinivorans TaxID=1445662 RepID=A0A432ZQ59_9GAMM|nr:class III extradiol ring-cleavage dioxygenase [Idiomarina tyrosinivorans]RUO79982.1 dioxygenase [Idiomarina tyrosinivorans]